MAFLIPSITHPSSELDGADPLCSTLDRASGDADATQEDIVAAAQTIISSYRHQSQLIVHQIAVCPEYRPSSWRLPSFKALVGVYWCPTELKPHDTTTHGQSQPKVPSMATIVDPATGSLALAHEAHEHSPQRTRLDLAGTSARSAQPHSSKRRSTFAFRPRRIQQPLFAAGVAARPTPAVAAHTLRRAARTCRACQQPRRRVDGGACSMADRAVHQGARGVTGATRHHRAQALSGGGNGVEVAVGGASAAGLHGPALHLG